MDVRRMKRVALAFILRNDGSMKTKLAKLTGLTSLLFLLLFGTGTPSSCAAQGSGAGGASSHTFGLGFELGEPTALSAKLWLNHENALDFGLSFAYGDYVSIFMDYLFHFSGAFGHSSTFVSQLTPYVGIGGELAFANDRYYYRDRRFFGYSHNAIGFGVRVPLGIEWTPSRPPLGVFVELVPGISLIPSTSGLVEGGIGVRYYF
jgi:hypothetical protein